MPVCKYGVDNEDMPVEVWCRYARCCHVPMSPTTYYTTSSSSPIRREDIRQRLRHRANNHCHYCHRVISPGPRVEEVYFHSSKNPDTGPHHPQFPHQADSCDQLSAISHNSDNSEFRTRTRILRRRGQQRITICTRSARHLAQCHACAARDT